MPSKDDIKVQKKLAKSQTKADKKGPSTTNYSTLPTSDPAEKTPAERSAEAAEKQLSLHRWKVIFAAVSALIALVSLIVLLLR